MWCTLNLLSDGACKSNILPIDSQLNMLTLAVIGLPIAMVWNLKMSKTVKIGLYFLFSLAAIIIVFEIFRVFYAIHGENTSELYLGVLFEILEYEIALIISTLVPYRKLLTKDNLRRFTGRSTGRSSGKLWSRSARAWTPRRIEDPLESSELTDMKGSQVSGDYNRAFSADQHHESLREVSVKGASIV